MKISRKTIKPIIDRCDSQRLGDDAKFFYVTPEMSDKDNPLEATVLGGELEQFIKDNELTDDNDRAYEYLLDCWEDVKDDYWTEILLPELEEKHKQRHSNLRRAV